MKIIITDENIELIDASVEEAAVSISVLVNTIRGIMHSKENEVMIDNILKKNKEFLDNRKHRLSN